MKLSFLLRFQEPCPDDTPTRLLGTQTATRQRAESADADPSAIGYTALIGDPARSAAPIPIAATKTWTFVRNEATDSDTERKSHRVMHTCS